MKMPGSLQGRLLLLVLGPVVGVWFVTASLTWIDVREELDELLDSHLAQAAALLVVQQAAEIDDDHPGVDAPTLHRYAPKVAFQVFHEGRLAQRSSNAPTDPMLDVTGSAADGYKTIAINGTAWRVFATHGRERDVQVFVGEQVASRNAILWAVLRSSLGPALLAVPLLALAVWWAVRQGVAPLRLVGRVLAQRSPQALQPLTVRRAPSEMTPMLDALNGLFGRISALLEAERRFTADAAHELRTPIAAIRAQAQVALGATADAERRHALHATLQGCDRATHLVEQLLTLSRLESGSAPVLVDIDAAAVARRVLTDAAPLALSKQQTIEFDATKTCSVRGDAALLSVMLRNLVDNAIRYSPAGASVKLVVTDVQGAVQLSLDDSGPGMSADDMERLGKRLFRVVGSGQEGSGLGWSITRRIAAVHRAELHVARSTTLGGLSVQVRFPVDQAAVADKEKGLSA